MRRLVPASRPTLASAVVLCTLLSACGGSDNNSNGPALPGATSQPSAPVLSSVQASAADAQGRIFLTAAVAEPGTVTAYCFKTSEQTPSVNDACFISSQRSATLTRQQTTQVYHVWAKNSAGQISEPLRVIVEADVQAPKPASVQATVQANGDVLLSASASDDHAVTGYCFAATDSRPSADNACFTAASHREVPLENPARLYHVWARDGAGNIANIGQLYAGCSPSTVIAGAASPSCLSGTLLLDVSAPTLVSVQASVQPNGDVLLSASASDDRAVTGYCFATTDTRPTAGSSCFTALSNQAVTVENPARLYHVWARDAAGNISGKGQVYAGCSPSTLVGGAASPACPSGILAPDTAAPVLASVQAIVQTSGNVLLVASASDDRAVTGYCFATTDTRPSPDSACFGPQSSLVVPLEKPARLYHVWVRDATGNINAESRQIYAGCSPAAHQASDASALPTVCMSTSMGEAVIALEEPRAPNTVRNFLGYVGQGYYSGTIFHRVISNFMVQGGGYTSPNVKKPNGQAPIALESTNTTGLSHVRGTVAMARTNDPNSATTEFFINVVNNDFLNYQNSADPGYAVFGRVIYGLDTAVEAIRNVAVQSNGAGENSLPRQPPVIHWMVRMK